MPLPFVSSLTVVVPAYNERENLPTVLAELLSCVRAHTARCEILVVDDGSTDGTLEGLDEALRSAPEVRVLGHARNRGLTASLRTGFYGARHEIVTWVPADGQIPTSELLKILDAWRGEDLLLSCYRHRPDGLWRTVMSRSLRLMLYAMTGFRDRLEGPYLFRRTLIDELELVARSSAGSIGLEIGAKARAQGKSVGSTEIECAPRLSGRSKVANLRNVASYLGELWRIRRSMRRHM